jgi:hypothetical protein
MKSRLGLTGAKVKPKTFIEWADKNEKKALRNVSRMAGRNKGYNKRSGVR